MTSRIKISQAGLAAGVAGRSRTDGLANGALVTLEDVGGAGDGTSTFHLVWGPPDDTTAKASLAVTGDLDVWTFSPQAARYGSYEVELRVNGVPLERRIFGIRTPANGLLIPALLERASRHANWTNDGADQIELCEQNANDFPLSVLNNFRYAGWWRSLYELYRVVEFGIGSIANNALALAKLVQAASAPSVIGATSNGNFAELPLASLAASETAPGFVEFADATEANALSLTTRAVSPGRIPVASDTQVGIAERATAAECNALTDQQRFVTPGRIPIASLTQQGLVELATAAEANALADAVRAITPATLPTSSTSQRGTVQLATAADQEAGTAADRAVTPSVQHRHPSAAKAWAQVGNAGGAPLAAYNITSITDGASSVTFTLATPFSSANYVVQGTAGNGTLSTVANNTLLCEATATRAAGAFGIASTDQANPNALNEPTWYQVVAFGDQ